MCLGHHKGGYDMATNYQMSTIAALMLNLKFHYSKMIFDNMINNLGDKKWSMYPRFLQILIDSQVFDLDKDAEDIMQFEHMNSSTFECLGAYRGRKTFTKFRGLFGVPNKIDYAN
ncbi:hypothetical protein Hanom_Chr02g00129571 [Helianthus anomalus]